MKTKILIFLMVASFIAFAAESLHVIPFQGRLTNQFGEPYQEGNYTIIFNLYDAPVGGIALWTERHESVGLINGMVNVFLGSITDLSNQDFTQSKYLGITIDADGNPNTPDPEMVPRQVIVPAFFAKNSEKLLGADWSAILTAGSNDPRTGYIAGSRIVDKGVVTDKLADNGVTTIKIKDGNVTSSKIAEKSILPSHLSSAALNDLASAFLPPGVIMPFAGTTIPAGWLPCDGRVVSSERYPALFNAIGTVWGSETNITENGITYFKLPDFRNRTLWGAEQKPVGSYIEPGLPNITGTGARFNPELWTPTTTHDHNQGAILKGPSYGECRLTGSNEDNQWAGYGWNFDASLSNPIYGASETVQPPAAAVNFIIKVDPTF